MSRVADMEIGSTIICTRHNGPVLLSSRMKIPVAGFATHECVHTKLHTTKPGATVLARKKSRPESG